MSAEDIKVASDYLRGELAADVAAGGDSFVGDSPMLLKFHGVYQQDDRDVRRQRTQAKQPLAHGCMVRASVPGGVISTEGWTALDALADIGDGTLRLTTRQGVQYHLVPKGNLVDLVSEINAAGLTTLGACGDVVRNVMACPLPDPARAAVLEPTVAALVGRFRARTAAYWELFVNGDRAASATSAPRPEEPGPDADGPVEPIYGEAYLPRKFKIGLAWPGDDCVDIHSHDVGLVPTLSEGTSGELTGFVVLAGGGMGMSHSRPDDTYPVVAQPLAWVPPEQVVDLVAAIVDTQRVHGNREDRSRARLKYLLEERGIDWLRSQVEERLGGALAPPTELPAWHTHAHLGWHDADGRPESPLDAGVDPLAAPPDGAVPVLLAPSRNAARAGGTLAVPIPSGRLDAARRRAINGIVVEGLVTELRVTPRQDLLLCGVRDRSKVTALLRDGGLPLAADQAPVRNLAIACPALPTCGQALGESERVLPDLVSSLEKLLADTGNAGLPLRLNMTGCPNGCARPYSAELGVVGRSKRTYDVYVGGSSGRLASRLRSDVLLVDIVDVLRPVLERFADVADPDTNFGDWADGVGVDAMQPWLPEPKSRRRKVAS